MAGDAFSSPRVSRAQEHPNTPGGEEANTRNSGRAILLAEYQACLTDVSQLDSDIWQSGSIFMGVSVLGISVLLQQRAQTWADFFVFLGTALLGTAVISIWRKLFSGWTRIMYINFYRMRELEEKLGMWRERYIQTLDETLGLPRALDMDNPRIVAIRKHLPHPGIGGPVGLFRIMRWLVYLIVCGWGALVLVQLIRVLSST